MFNGVAQSRAGDYTCKSCLSQEGNRMRYNLCKKCYDFWIVWAKEEHERMKKDQTKTYIIPRRLGRTTASKIMDDYQLRLEIHDNKIDDQTHENVQDAIKYITEKYL